MAPKSAVAAKTVFKVDYSKPVADSIFDGAFRGALFGPFLRTAGWRRAASAFALTAAEYEKYLHDRIKVDGKTGQLGEAITLKREATKLTITSTIPFSKRYVKYLTKKYLQKNVGGGFMRVVATSKDTFTLTYPHVADEGEAEADE
jgi:large subunit ribosomal protein L22e